LIFTTTCRTERREHIIEELHQFHFAHQALASDHIRIALVELAVSALLRFISTPHGLDLVALEGKG
jgi:hypothetical protein